MIRQLIIPGIIAGALHGGLFLIPSPPAPPPPPESGPVVVAVFPDLPKPPPIETEEERENRAQSNKGKPNLPPLPFVSPTPMPPIDTGGITEVFDPVMPPIDFDPNVMSPGPGDWRPEGITTEGFRDVIDAINLDEKPRTLFQMAPEYPSAAKSGGITGTVTVVFRVDEKGYVHDAYVASSTDNVFNEPALRAVGRWRFEPGRLHGKRVAFKMSVPIAFNLNDGE